MSLDSFSSAPIMDIALSPQRTRPSSSSSARKVHVPAAVTAPAAVSSSSILPSSSSLDASAPPVPLPASSSSSSSLPSSSRPIRPSTAPMGVSNGDASSSASSVLPRCRQSRAVPPEAIIHNLPSLLLTPPGLARKALFSKKVRLCCHMVDIGSGSAARYAALSPAEAEAADRARETKRLTLLELVNFHTLARPLWGADELTAVFDMMSWNLLRPLPPNSFELHSWSGHARAGGGAGAGAGGFTFSPEEDPQIEDSAWTHIQICYELLLRMVSFIPSAQAQQTMANAAAAAAASPLPNKENPYPEPVPSLQQLQTSHKLLYGPSFLSRKFIVGLLGNFSSEDSRERDYLKTIVHRIYGQSMSLRPFIRRNIQYILCELIHVHERCHGISELLEILGSIINGFAVPLKAQHVSTMLTRILLPLHKLTHLALFHPQLSYCMVQFVEKDATLVNQIVLYILSVWPARNSRKELLFLNEIEEIIQRIPDQTKTDEVNENTAAAAAVPTTNLHLPVLIALITKLSSCLYNLHFQVSEKSIYMLSSESILRKLVFFANGANPLPGADHRETIVPIIARAVHIKSVVAPSATAQSIAKPTPAEPSTEIPLINSLLDPTAAAPVHRSSDAAVAAASAAVKAIRLNSAAASSSDAAHPDSPRSNASSSSSVSESAPLFGGGATSPSSSLPPTKGHWNATITDLSSDVSRIMMELDAKLWTTCTKQIRAEFAAAARGPATKNKIKLTGVNLAEAHAAVARANAAMAAAQINK